MWVQTDLICGPVKNTIGQSIRLTRLSTSGCSVDREVALGDTPLTNFRVMPGGGHTWNIFSKIMKIGAACTNAPNAPWCIFSDTQFMRKCTNAPSVSDSAPLERPKCAQMLKMHLVHFYFRRFYAKMRKCTDNSLKQPFF